MRYAYCLFLITMTIFSSFVLSCQQISDTESQQKSVIGNDDRKLLSIDEPISESIGALVVNGIKICTAFAVQSDKIITPVHCLTKAKEDEKITFLTAKNVSYKIQKPAEDVEKLINKQLVKLTILSAQPSLKPLILGDLNDTGKVKLIGYSRPKNQYLVSVVGNLKAYQYSDGVLSHTFDTSGGTSGSPILQDNKVVAIHLGTTKSGDMNFAIASDALEKSIPVIEVFNEFVDEAWNCNTNCEKECRVCANLPFVGKKCVTEYACATTCMYTKAAACAINIGQNVGNSNHKAVIYGNYCGPGHKGEGGPGNKPYTLQPIDDLDIACLAHDRCCDTAGILKCGMGKCECDIPLSQKAIQIVTDSSQSSKKEAALLIGTIFSYCTGIKAQGIPVPL